MKDLVELAHYFDINFMNTIQLEKFDKKNYNSLKDKNEIRLVKRFKW